VSAVLDIQTISDAGELAALAPQWWELWEHAPAATPFQSPAWLIPWWQAFAPGRLMTVAVWDDNKLVALAPLYLETGPLGHRLLPIGISLGDYLDILVDSSSDEALGGIGWQLSRWKEWETCELTCLAPGAAALSLPCPVGCKEAQESSDTCPVLYLSAQDGLDAGTHPAIQARQRRKLRMARNRLSRGPAWSIVDTGDLAASQWLDELIRLHTTRWTERREVGVLGGECVQTFHGSALSELIDRKIARLFALRIGGEVAGIYYGFCARGRAYAYIGGFDPRFAFFSPGTVLLGHAIEKALQEGIHEFHFLRGGEAYKYAWGAVDQHSIKRTFTRSMIGA